MAEPNVLPPVEGPIFDDEDDILAGLDGDEAPDAALPADDAEAALAGRLGERPPGLTNSEWLHRHEVVARQYYAEREYVRSGKAAQIDAARAERDQLRQAAREPGVPPNAPPPPNQPTGPVDIYYFGHEQDILPPVPGAIPANAARLRHRYDWNAIAADVVTGENELTLTRRHGITVKALRRALKRSENFQDMVDWHRRHRARAMESTIEDAAERMLPRAFKRAMEESDIYRAAAVVQMVGTLGNASRREQRARDHAGAKVVQIGPNLVQIGSQRYKLVPVNQLGPTEAPVSAISGQPPRRVPDHGSGPPLP